LNLQYCITYFVYNICVNICINMSMDRMPPEIMSVVFESLNLIDIVSCFSVCKKWQQILQYIVIYEKLYIDTSIYPMVYYILNNNQFNYPYFENEIYNRRSRYVHVGTKYASDSKATKDSFIIGKFLII
jgi:hypothetical protein